MRRKVTNSKKEIFQLKDKDGILVTDRSFLHNFISISKKSNKRKVTTKNTKVGLRRHTKTDKILKLFSWCLHNHTIITLWNDSLTIFLHKKGNNSQKA